MIPVTIEGMTEVEEILEKGHMIETEEGILYLKADPEVTAIQEQHIEDNCRDRGNSRQQCSRSKSRPLYR